MQLNLSSGMAIPLAKPRKPGAGKKSA